MTVIQLDQITKSYRSQQVVNKVKVNIKENSLTGIIGRNGVGKTTLMRMIAGYTAPDEGNISVFGENPFNNVTVACNTIFIDDKMVFPHNMTLEYILKSCEQFYNHWNKTLAFRLIEHFQLPLQSKPHLLSKGKRSTFLAIIGIASRSPLTIFDEPTNGMDSVVRKDFYRALLKDYILHPRTILLSSHHLEEIDHLLEDILLIHDKSVLFHGAIDDLQEKYIALSAPKETIEQWIVVESRLFTQTMGPYEMVIVENNFTAEQLEELTNAGMKIANVSANDAYIAMTSHARGGIDHVFK